MGQSNAATTSTSGSRTKTIILVICLYVMHTNTGVIALYRFCCCFRSPFPCFFLLLDRLNTFHFRLIPFVQISTLSSMDVRVYVSVCVVHVDVYLRRSDVTIEKHNSLSSIVVVTLVEGWRGQAPAAVCLVETKQKREEGEIKDKACNQNETVNGALCRSSLSVTSAAATALLLLFSFLSLLFCISVHLATVLVVAIVVLVL